MNGCMAFFLRHSRLLLLLTVLLAGGCEFSTGNKEASSDELPDWLTQEPNAPAGDEETNGAKLSLNLKVGDQFPLKKVVEQELTQSTVSGTPLRNNARLELVFGITVDAVEQDRTRLSVRYNRVRYSHDVAGERVDFDSSYPPNPVPVRVRAYHDMVGDGFSFWLGKDNQIAAVDGFSEFVDRCLRNVPPEQRNEVMLGIEAGAGDTGFANFIDNSIGLLPFDSRQIPGSSWERTSSINRPVPMHIVTRYTLQDLSPAFAVVDVREEITPSTAVSAVESGGGVRVTVVGGSAAGQCTIFRDTGLPKQSRVERTVDMVVQLADAIHFNQQKRIVTTIEAFPSPGNAKPTVIGLGR